MPLRLSRGEPEEKGKSTYRTLDAWRGLAALLVVAYHTAAITTGRFAGLAVLPLYAAFKFGYLGVQVFFVISGFCIATSAMSILRRHTAEGEGSIAPLSLEGRGVGGEGYPWSAITTYLTDRGRRIYPPCWFSLLFYGLFTIVAAKLVDSGHMTSSVLASRDILHQTPLYLFTQLTLTQMIFRQGFLSIVCWTLCYEVAFYLIVGVFLLPGLSRLGERRILDALHVLTLACLAMLTLRPDLRYYPLDLWPQFGMGIVAYDVLRNRSSAAPKIWLAAIAVATGIFLATSDLPMSILRQMSRPTFTAALIFMFAIIGLRQFDEALSRTVVMRVLAGVGGFSYSLYLTHFLTIGIVGQALRMLHLDAEDHLIYTTVSISAAIGAGWLFYQIFERPFLKRKPTVTPLPRPLSPPGKGEKEGLRILFLADAVFKDKPGGSRVVARELARGLAGRGHDVTFLVARHNDEAPDDETVNSIRIVRYRGAGSMLDFVRSGREACRTLGDFDIVHTHFAYAALGPMSVLSTKTRHVRTFHGPWDEEGYVEDMARANGIVGRVKAEVKRLARRQVEQVSLRQSQRVTGLSDFFRRRLIDRFGVSPDRIDLISGGVDGERFKPAADPEAVRQSLGLPVDRPILFTVRRLAPRMGLDILIQAMPAVLKAQPDVLLLIGGKGPEAARLDNLIRSLGLADNVRLVGFIPDDDLVAYYQSADLFVLPTTALEGFGLVTVEALACGVPVVGTPVGATPEILGELDRRLIAKAATAEAIADAVVDCLTGDWHKDLTPGRLHRYATDRYSWENYVRQTEALYYRCLDGPSTDRRTPPITNLVNPASVAQESS